jgi:hypothetical protein
MSLQNMESVFTGCIDILHDLKCKAPCGGGGVNVVACSASRQCFCRQRPAKRNPGSVAVQVSAYLALFPGRDICFYCFLKGEIK